MFTYTIAISKNTDNEFIFLDIEPPLDNAVRSIYFIYKITAPTLDDAIAEAKQRRAKQLNKGAETMLVDSHA